jgi:aminopeptidase N
VRHQLIAPVAAATLLLAVPAAAAQPSPGAPGVGDPYYPAYGNGGYDVAHYDLRLRYRPEADRLTGTATLLVTATQDLTRFNLDFALDVRRVRVDGRPAEVATSGAHELEVTPARPLKKGQRATVVVRYAGTPSDVEVNGSTAWHRTPDGGFAASEPESAWWWFPSNDHPTDKATYDVSVAVPDGTEALSNGTLESRRPRDGWTRWSWRSREPQATYLATLAVGQYRITRDTTASGLAMLNAYSENLGEHEGAARASIERTGEITEWLTRSFGPYPFHAVGGYVPDTEAGYALETQTRPFYSPRFFDAGSNTYVVTHEMAHQWYGDNVSLEQWDDIWLNEGFASYAEWLWSEHTGEGTAAELAAYAYASIPADAGFWTVRPGDPGAENQFHSAVYNRGAMAVQALRTRVGDRDFFAILKGWQERHGGSHASVRDFTAYAEEVSGESLADLFDTWLFTPSKPPVGPNGERGAAGGKRGPGTAPRGAARGVPEQPESWPKIQRAREGERGHHGRPGGPAGPGNRPSG